jgi:hypothetical protein
VTNLALLALLALPPPPTAAASDTPLAARLEDPQVDQAWLSPTALTQPAGTVTLENHELLVGGVTVAPLDRLQLSLVGVLPVLRDSRLLQGVAKLRVLDAGPLHVSLMAGGGFERALFTVAEYERPLLSAGAVASLCVSPACRGIVSLYALANFGSETAFDSSTGGSRTRRFTKVYYGGSVVAPLSQRFKAVAELDIVGESHPDWPQRSNAAWVTTGMLGLRIHGRRVAGTVGLLATYKVEEDWYATDSISVFVVLPAASLTVRLGG